MAYLGYEPGSESLIQQIKELEAAAKRLTAGVSAEAMRWRPPDGGWSVAQVFEHLVISNRIYFPVMRTLVAEATPHTSGTPRPWKPSFFGRLMIRTLRPSNTRKVPTSGKLKPGPEPRENVVSEYLATLRETADIAWHAQSLDLSRLRLTSPVSPFVRRLNLGDALIILVVHAERHMKQIERVLASPGFPRDDRAGRERIGKSNPASTGAGE